MERTTTISDGTIVMACYEIMAEYAGKREAAAGDLVRCAEIGAEELARYHATLLAAAQVNHEARLAAAAAVEAAQ